MSCQWDAATVSSGAEVRTCPALGDRYRKPP